MHSEFWVKRARDPKVFTLVLDFLSLLHYYRSMQKDPIYSTTVSAGYLIAIMLKIPSVCNIKYHSFVKYGFMLSLLLMLVLPLDVWGRREQVSRHAWIITCMFYISFGIVGLFFHFYSFDQE